MKKAIVIFVFLFVNFLQINSFAKIENKIIVKVESQIITNLDIKNKIISSLILSNQQINQGNINKIKSQALDSLINLNLKKNELLKYSIKDDNIQINKYLNSVSSNNIELLKNNFKVNNLDFEFYLDEIKTELKWQKLIFNKFDNKINIDVNSINEEVENILRDQSKIEEFKISEIEVPSKNEKTDKQKIIEIQNLIKEIGFEDTAISYSISSSASNKGDLGWINSTSLSKKIFESINKMKVGDVSNPISSQNSIIFLKLVDKRIMKKNNLNKETLKKRIIAQKKNDLFNLYSRSYLSKIKNTSYIEFK